MTRVDLIELHVIVKPTTPARAERIGNELARALSAGGSTLETLVSGQVRRSIENVVFVDARGPESESEGED